MTIFFFIEVLKSVHSKINFSRVSKSNNGKTKILFKSHKRYNILKQRKD